MHFVSVLGTVSVACAGHGPEARAGAQSPPVGGCRAAAKMTAIRALPVHMAMVPHDILFGVPDEIMPSYLAESGDLMM